MISVFNQFNHTFEVTIITNIIYHNASTTLAIKTKDRFKIKSLFIDMN